METKNFIIVVGFLFLVFCFAMIFSIRKEKEFKANSETIEVVSLPEKVVIIEKEPQQWCRYKVRRINEGVVTFIRIRGVGRGNYSEGDTIYYKF
jgi:hypothetical protein